jgi:hypothetical protein
MNVPPDVPTVHCGELIATLALDAVFGWIRNPKLTAV